MEVQDIITEAITALRLVDTIITQIIMDMDTVNLGKTVHVLNALEGQPLRFLATINALCLSVKRAMA